MMPEAIIKRDGSRVPFEIERITEAIDRAQRSVGIIDAPLAEELSSVVLEHLHRIAGTAEPGIEDVQDAVIYVLQESGNYPVALAFMRYRDTRERMRRTRRLEGGEVASPNLSVVGRDGRSRPWNREMLTSFLRDTMDLNKNVSEDIVRLIEEDLANTDVNEMTSLLLLSMVDSAMVRCGLHRAAEKRAPLRCNRTQLRQHLESSTIEDGAALVRWAGNAVLSQMTIAEVMPAEVARLYSIGRLWVDGLDDPLRGSQYAASLDGNANPWQIIAQAYNEAVAAKPHWRTTRLIMPPLIIGHLERGADALLEPLENLAKMAEVYLYCDGRTPLLDEWPFASKRISIASYAEDFLLLRRLQELGLEHRSGPHLMQGGYRKRVAVMLALNAQGLEDQFTQMDHLAMGLVAAAKMRQQQLSRNTHLVGADIRYAIYGLPPNSPSNEYIERQVVQEGLRNGIALSRFSNLPVEACEHLGKLFA